jgi:hypothetical protein
MEQSIGVVSEFDRIKDRTEKVDLAGEDYVCMENGEER